MMIRVLLVVLLGWCAKGWAEDWPQFMPDGRMVSPETGLRTNLTDLVAAWTHEKGEGFTAPVVADGRVFCYHRERNEEMLDCLDPATGKLLWRQTHPTRYADRYGYNGGPRATPCVVNDRVISHGVEGTLSAHRVTDGELLWRRDLLKDYGIEQNFFGVGCSPVLIGTNVFLNVGSEEGPEVIAVDPATGKTAWTVPGNWGASYASPVPARIGGRDKVLVFAGGDRRPPVGALLSIDLERKALDYSFPWRCERYESVNASSPLAVGDDVFVSYSILGGKGALVGPDGKAKWTSEALGVYWMTPLLLDGHIYGIHGEKTSETELVCLDAKTGAVKWKAMPEWKETVEVRGEEREMTFRIGRGSLVEVDGKVLCLGEYGHLLWLELTPDGVKVLDRVQLFLADQTWSAPVVSNGWLYVMQHKRDMLGRGGTRLHAYDFRAK